ncbi:M56 family metallopeptidase [Winogradskyella sp. Asnod2-B02-A]|uniref:M56 family metallopeptidase n=1 Tax=Winogradskyella sp. Asnod2-B02-A TaxID=3160583 RepID=UPI0038630671
MEYLLKASAVIVLFYLCYLFLLKKETFFQHNRWFLFIGLVIALVFPLLVIPIYIPIEPSFIQETVYNPIPPTNFIEATPIQKSFDWSSLISMIYSVGLALFLIQFIFQFGSLALLLIKNSKVKDGIYTYVIIESKISPFSFFKWIVYNPVILQENELDLILTHEKVHANQLHSIDILLTQLACVIFWFNPLIWLYRKEVRQNLEYIADSETQTISENEKEYQHLLLKTGVANHNISLPNNFYNSSIKKRILMLNKSRSNRKKQWRYALILPLLAGLLMSVNTEKVYIENNTNNETITKEDKVFSIITKDTKDSELEHIINKFKQKEISLNFNDLKRNSNNEITNIAVKLADTKYESNDNISIESFIIYKELFEKKGSFIGRYGNGTFYLDLDSEYSKNNPAIKSFTNRINKLLAKYNLTDKVIEKYKITDQKRIEIVFTKRTTDNQLEDIIKTLKSIDVIMVVKRIKRDQNSEIKAIDIDFKTKTGSTNYSAKNNDGIKSFYFNTKDDGSFRVGTIKENVNILEVTKVDNSPKQDSILVQADTNKTYVVAKKDTVYYGIIDSLEIKRFSQEKPNLFYENEKNVKFTDYNEEIILHQPQVGYKVISNYTKKDPEPLIIVDGKEASHDMLKSLNANLIESMTVLKDKSAIKKYGDKGKNGVIIMTTKADKTVAITYKNTNSEIHFSNEDNLLYILDGKEISKSDLQKVYSKETVSSLKVLKEKEAKEKYGEKGANGVVEVISKNAEKSPQNKTTKKDNPWKIVGEPKINSLTYIDDEDPSKNGSFAYISKSTPDQILDSHVNELKSIGITVKYSKLKRNKDGKITSIKISLIDNEGRKNSATWKVTNGIPDIEFGKSEGSLIVRSK